MPVKDLEGVFVEGKPLAEYLGVIERDDKSRDIEDIRKQSELKRKLTIVYSNEKGGPEDTRKVARRVRHLTDREIRKEYGIMTKPFASKAHNAIWAIWEKGPLTVKQIADEIEFKGSPSSASAMISTIWGRLGNQRDPEMDILERNQHDNYYLYSKKPGVDISVEQAIERYQRSGSRQYRQKSKEKKAYTNVEPSKPITKKTEAILQEILGVDAAKDLGIKIEVSGRVDIVFRFER